MCSREMVFHSVFRKQAELNKPKSDVECQAEPTTVQCSMQVQPTVQDNICQTQTDNSDVDTQTARVYIVECGVQTEIMECSDVITQTVCKCVQYSTLFCKKPLNFICGHIAGLAICQGGI